MVATGLAVGGCNETAAHDGSGGATGGGGGGVAAANAGAVINEIQAYGEEWVELANPTDEVIDLSDFGLCDEDAEGACEIAKAMRFPAGTTLPAMGYILVLTDQEGDPGPSSVCVGSVASCYHATWKVSAKDGETIRLVDPSDALVAELRIPPAATEDEAMSWSRIPDMTGEAVAATPSPGGVNTP